MKIDLLRRIESTSFRRKNAGPQTLPLLSQVLRWNVRQGITSGLLSCGTRLHRFCGASASNALAHALPCGEPLRRLPHAGAAADGGAGIYQGRLQRLCCRWDSAKIPVELPIHHH